MRRLSAQIIFTGDGPPLRRGIITTDDTGLITDVEDTNGELRETESVEFYNGIIIPGLVNCHCHTELSHMKGTAVAGEGLPRFIEMIRSRRESGKDYLPVAMKEADKEMHREGIRLCADICNTTDSFGMKSAGIVRYVNFLEIFGVDPGKARKRLDEILQVSEAADAAGLKSWIVPHAAYSLSLTLFRLLKELTYRNRVTSIHFMETEDERRFLADRAGPIMESYINSGLKAAGSETVRDHASAILEEITPSGILILVHNTFADRETIRRVKKRGDTFWCLCPNSNRYIEISIPPVNLLLEEGCTIVTGTDSLASNNRLSILEELKTLQEFYPNVPLNELIKWGTINGARALGEEDSFGSITTGKRPGLVLLTDVDLSNLKLLKETGVMNLM